MLSCAITGCQLSGEGSRLRTRVTLFSTHLSRWCLLVQGLGSDADRPRVYFEEEVYFCWFPRTRNEESSHHLIRRHNPYVFLCPLDQRCHSFHTSSWRGCWATTTQFCFVFPMRIPLLQFLASISHFPHPNIGLPPEARLNYSSPCLSY